VNFAMNRLITPLQVNSINNTIRRITSAPRVSFSAWDVVSEENTMAFDTKMKIERHDHIRFS
jgi:hypothetical protein